MELAGENAISPKQIGMHRFDIRETINSWVQGLSPNYGLGVAATDEGADGGAFYTTEATADNAGQIGFTPDKAPSLTIHWSVPDPVDVNYPISDMTINLRTMVKSDKSAKLQFQGVFADGLTTPGAEVAYELSDPAKTYAGKGLASFSYKYPDTAGFIDAFDKGTTQYKDKLSNWQTILPFTEPDLNTVYTIDAESQKDGQSSGKKSSDTFLIYKVTQYDTLPKIANYYGVPLKQLAYDNRIQDMLVVANNTLFIRNPKQNLNKPYNPPTLTDGTKKEVDMLLMGRGLHCEFDFEPINLNTGNFYLDRTDVTIPDVNGAFEITRFYNSKAAGLNSLFGRGWSFAFNEQLSSDEEGNLYYTRTDGSIVKFTKDGDHYTASAGYDLTLEVKAFETKQGDFGGDAPEDYEVKSYHIRDTDNQEKVFNFYGLLTSQRDEKGNQTQFDYNEAFQLTKITSPTGLVYGITYNEAGYIGAIQVPNGSTLTYAYDEAGNLISYTDATGGVTRYEYDDKGLMTAWYDGNGTRVVQNAYDEDGRVVKQTDGAGGVSILAYSDGQTITTDANGHQTVYTYDDQYRTTGIAYPDGTSLSKTYNEANRLASETNELGQTTSYTYDDKGNVLTETRFDGAVKSFSYDSHNHLLSVTDFGGEVTSHSYDDKENLIQTTLPDGTSLFYTVDDQGRILSTTDAQGAVTSFAYEGANLVKITNPLGGVSTLTYNAHNQVTGITNSRGGTSTFTYDAEGRKLSEVDADGVGSHFTFDNAGQVLSLAEGNGNTTSFTYDGFGRKISASNGEGGTYTYTYDGVGNQLSVTDPEGHTTSYTYDSRKRLLTETDALGQTISYQRDALGRVLSRINEAGNSSRLTYDDRHQAIQTITDALGQVTENTYDTSGRLTEVSYPIGTTTQTTYDVMGRVLSYIDEAGETVSYSYDAVGNKLTETKGDKTTSYTYDLAGNKLTSTESIDGKEEKTTFTYDDNNRLTKLESKDGSVTYTYDQNGNRVSQSKNNEKLDYIYDTENRLLAVKDKEGFLMAALYDGDDNRVFTASRKEGKNTYQLFQRKPKESSTHSGGKKSPYTAPAGEENSIFWYGFSQNVLQALSSLPQTIGTIWHDIFDEVSTAYHKKVAKDRANSEGLVVNPPELGNLPGEGAVTYASEVSDALIPYTTREDRYHYYEERNYVNDVNRKHTEVLQTYDQEQEARETYTYGHSRLSYLDNQTDKSYNYLTNQSGSVTGLSHGGQAVSATSYHLYGSTKSSTDQTGQPYAYNGEARDNTGLDYLRARYYDSEAGTFLTADSYPGQLVKPLTQNTYAYVGNNPVNYTDPSGHFWKSIKKAASNAWNGVKKAASNAWNTVKQVATNTWNTVKNATTQAVNWVSNKVNQAVNWVGNQFNKVSNWVGTQVHNVTNWATQQWNNFQQPSVVYASSGGYGGGYGNSSYSYVQQQQAQARAQVEQRHQQYIRDDYAQATGIKTTPKTREGNSLFRNWGKALKDMYTHVCKTAERVKKQAADYIKKIDWKKVAVSAGAISIGIVLTVATGGLGAPVAMAIGGAATGAIMSGYDAYTSGQRGWELLGSIAKGAGMGGLTGFVGSSLMGVGSGLATNLTQNIGNQALRQVARVGIEAGVETAIDTGLDLAAGNQVTGQTIAMNLAYNAVTNGAGSVSTKQGSKAEVNAGKSTYEEVRRTPEVEIQFNRNSKHDADEFSRQLKNQQDGMNKLTVEDYVNNRGDYLANGRSSAGNAAQKAVRQEAWQSKIDELVDSGLTYNI